MARPRLTTAFLLLAQLTGVAILSAQSAEPRQVKVAVDPKSTADAQSHLIANGFHEFCPAVAIIRDESQADYVVLASNSDRLRGALLHYYITVYDKGGTVVFSVDKHHGKAASKEACRFITSQTR